MLHGWPSMNEQQIIQPNDPQQKMHGVFYLKNLKAILFYSLFSVHWI